MYTVSGHALYVSILLRCRNCRLTLFRITPHYQRLCLAWMPSRAPEAASAMRTTGAASGSQRRDELVALEQPPARRQRTGDATLAIMPAGESKAKGGKGKEEGGAAKQGKASKAEVDAVLEVLPALVKLSLRSAQQGRAQQAMMMDTFMLKNESEVVQAIEADMRGYTVEVTRHGAQRTLCPPHIHAWMGLVEGVFVRLTASQRK